MATYNTRPGYQEWQLDYSENIIQKPVEVHLDWGDILKGRADSERCGVCGEVKHQKYFAFGKVEEEELFVCSKKCLYYSWDDVVQLLKKKGMTPVCSLPGCITLCGRKGHGTFHDYCTIRHRDEHKVAFQNFFPYVELGHCNLPVCNRLCPKFGLLDGYCCKKHMQTTLPCSHCRTMKESVKFYHSDSSFYEFSNFYQFAPFLLEDLKWKSTEHYFQAKKFVGTPYEKIIRDCDSPRKALELSRKYSDWIRGDWNDVKLKVMYLALLAKFSSHERLRLLLCSTGNREIRESTINDNFWGDGGGSGANHLGRLLVKVRSVVRGDKDMQPKT